MKIRKETKIGLIAFLSIIIIYVGMNYLKGIYIFEKPTIYHGVYEKINGLEVSNPVLLNGYKIGQVKQIDIVNDGSGKLAVAFMVSEEIDIPNDSKALLKAVDLLG